MILWRVIIGCAPEQRVTQGVEAEPIVVVKVVIGAADACATWLPLRLLWWTGRDAGPASMVLLVLVRWQPECRPAWFAV